MSYYGDYNQQHHHQQQQSNNQSQFYQQSYDQLEYDEYDADGIGLYQQGNQNYENQYAGDASASGEIRYDDDVAPVIHEEGVWIPHSMIPSPSIYDRRSGNKVYSVSSITYDTTKELVWVSYDNGRVSSYTNVTPDSSKINQVVDELEVVKRYTSFMVSDDAAVQVLPLHHDSVMTICKTKIRIHTSGGLPINSVALPTNKIYEDKTPDEISNNRFTCGTLLRPTSALVTGTDDTGPTHVLAGTELGDIYAYDMRHYMKKPCVSYTMPTAVSCIKSSGGGLYTVAGCKDGKLRLLDGRLRASTIKHTLDAHAGPISDVSIQPDGITMLSCGVIGRVVNPGDSKGLIKYVPDPLVRVFDLRMNKQLAPISMSMGSPAFVNFVPSFRGDGTSAVLMASHTGIVQVCNLGVGGMVDPNALQMMYIPLNDRKEMISSIGVSTSGHYMSIGLTSGAVNQYMMSLPSDDVHRISHISEDVHILPTIPTPPTHLVNIDDPILAASYVFIGKKGDTEATASSFLTTPKVLNKTLKVSTARIISDELLKKVTINDFIGSVSNPGYPINSMIFDKTAKKAYSLCDPRKKNDSNSDTIPADSFVFQVPVHYCRVRSPRGKQRFHKFKYSAHNKTKHIGLENSCPNSYTIPMLQFIYSLPEIQSSALMSQMSAFHHSNPATLLCELGFLFHMMKSIEKHSASSSIDNRGDNNIAVEKIVTPANFQRIYQQAPEAVALSLFDGSMTDVQLLIQTFIRFLLQQLQQEYDQEYTKQVKTKAAALASMPSVTGLSSVSQNSSNAAAIAAAGITLPSVSAVEYIFGYSVGKMTTFLHSQTQEIGVPNRSFYIDLVYPSVSKLPHKSGKDEHTTSGTAAIRVPSFAVLLWSSIQKESHMKGWCSASETYEPFKQVRSVLTLPRILNLLCGDTQRDPKETTISGALGEATSIGCMHTLFWSQSNALGGSYLPDRIEIAIQKKDASQSKNALTYAVPKLLVSVHLLPNLDDATTAADGDKWVIYDGKSESIVSGPATADASYGITGDEWNVSTYNLLSVMSQITAIEKDTVQITKHIVLHSKVKASADVGSQWMLFNDFSITESSLTDVTTFAKWRHPCSLAYISVDYEPDYMTNSVNEEFVIPDFDQIKVPSTVLLLPSLSQHATIRLPNLASLPDCGDHVAFDGEFVSVEMERTTVNEEGQRIVTDEGRQILARVSLVDTGSLTNNNLRPVRIIADDYILPSEQILDYVTRFSGIIADDLSPGVSRHAVVTNRTAYLKLRFFLDRGCIFVGHGLQKDFDTANVFVPPEQICDTVELWRLPNQRKISLRFLASYVLKSDIQDEIHDSIEDAKTAMLLYRKYQQIMDEGGIAMLTKVLNELYEYGVSTSWTIGLDSLRIVSS